MSVSIPQLPMVVRSDGIISGGNGGNSNGSADSGVLTSSTGSALQQAQQPTPFMTAFQNANGRNANNSSSSLALAALFNIQRQLFTVEQLELIRRLRSTGIGPEAVLEAFQTLEKIETEIPNIGLAAALMGAGNGSPSSVVPSTTSNPTSATTPPCNYADVVKNAENIPQVTSMIQTSASGTPTNTTPVGFLNGASPPTFFPHPHHQLQGPPPGQFGGIKQEMLGSPPNLSPERHTLATVPFASTAGGGPDMVLLNQLVAGLGASAPGPPLLQAQQQQPSTSSNPCRPIRSQRTPMIEITTLDDPSELDDFMAQGEEGCINDMKQFITQFSLRQTTVAMMTGVSQPYISKLLNGNHRELSLRCRKNIYCWYLNCRRHPEKLTAFIHDPSTRLETNGDGELIPQRRERYVFKPILIKILEQYFAEIPFPDYNKRVEIAAACNNALAYDKKGAGLMPKEVVSAQVVANWFANKRKEMRRRSNEDAPPMSAGFGGGPGCFDDSAPPAALHRSTPPSPEQLSLVGCNGNANGGGGPGMGFQIMQPTPITDIEQLLQSGLLANLLAGYQPIKTAE